MTHVIDKSRIGTKASGRDERPRAGSIHPASDASAFAADEQFRIGPDERINRAPNFGHGSAMSDAPADPRASEPADDSGQGLAMFVIFTGAVLIVTGAVALLALVNSWWMLGVAFVVHVAMTAIVVLAILHAMAGHTVRSPLVTDCHRHRIVSSTGDPEPTPRRSRRPTTWIPDLCRRSPPTADSCRTRTDRVSPTERLRCGRVC